MKKSKENLIEEVANLKHDNERMLLQDQITRKKFAKALKYDYDREYKLPSWEEVFVEIGKLLASRNFMDYERNISELEYKLQDLEERIKKELLKNL